MKTVSIDDMLDCESQPGSCVVGGSVYYASEDISYADCVHPRADSSSQETCSKESGPSDIRGQKLFSLNLGCGDPVECLAYRVMERYAKRN